MQQKPSRNMKRTISPPSRRGGIEAEAHVGSAEVDDHLHELHEGDEAEQRQAEAGQRTAVRSRKRSQVVGELVEPICTGHRVRLWGRVRVAGLSRGCASLQVV